MVYADQFFFEHWHIKKWNWHRLRFPQWFSEESCMNGSLKKLSEQVIVLTGATSGIGLATARMAAGRGAKLVLTARNEDALRKLTEELHNQGASACYVLADVGRQEEVQHVGEVAIARFGRIDTWINNAGVGIFGRNEDVSTEDKRQVFETNFWGVVYGSLAAVKHLKANGGALINIGSGFSDRAAPLQGIYSASKHAVKGFTDSLRIELAQERAPISVTLIKPASVNSMFVAHAKSYLEVEPKLPPPMYAPETVARAILYAAEHPKRDIYVGGAAKLLGLGAYYMPRLMDKGMQYLMFRLQKTDQPPRPHPHHNLYSASQDLQERSDVPNRVHETSWYTSVVTHPKASKALLLASGLALAAFLRAQRNTTKMPAKLRQNHLLS
jgi:short-subunit dehydrogenase